MILRVAKSRLGCRLRCVVLRCWGQMDGWMDRFGSREGRLCFSRLGSFYTVPRALFVVLSFLYIVAALSSFSHSPSVLVMRDAMK